MKRTLPLLLLAALCSGCVKTIVESDQVKVQTTRFLWPGSIGKASLTASNGTTLSLEGYQSDTAKLIEAMAAGVAAGAMKGARP